MKAYRVVMMVAGAGLAAVCQAQWQDLLLNDCAVTNENGKIIVLHDAGGGTTPEWEAEAAFDTSDLGTFYDANLSQGAWAGFELEEPKLITRVRYTGRQNFPGRINGTLIQGANESDFSDAVTLGTLQTPGGWNPLAWHTHNLTSPEVLQPYKFVRFFCAQGGSCGGNFSGVEFYGADPVETPPGEPVTLFNDCVNWRFNLRWLPAADALMYEIERQVSDEAAFTPLAEHYYCGDGGRREWYDGSLKLFCETRYRIRARNNAGDSGWVTLTNAPSNAATGAWLGTLGSYDNNNQTGERVFAGNISSFFDAPNMTEGNGAWTGLDFGAPRTIIGVRYLPRYEYPGRMTGGWFEAADNPDFLDAELLYSVAAQPPANSMTEGQALAPTTLRYARYCSPNGGWGNVSEVEFVLAPCAPNAPIDLSVSPVDMVNNDAVLTWSLSINSVVSSSMVYRATSPGGPYTCLTPEGVFARTFTDTGLATGVRYYYRVSAVLDDDGTPLEGEMSDHASYVPSVRLERDWNDLTHIKYGDGMALIGAGSPYGGNQNVDVHAMFDNNLGSFVDTDTKNAPVGVDLAKPYCIRFVRFAARRDFVGRLNGAELRGSNDDLNYLSNYTVLMTFQGAIAETLVTQQTANNQPFRYIFLQRSDEGEFYGNINELELYGWDPSLAGPTLISPSGLTAQTLPSGAIALAWQAGENEDFFRVERRPAGGGGAWAPLSPDTTATVFTNTAVTLGETYEYRVAAVRGAAPSEEVGYSASCFATAYLAGSGQGLMAHYYAPFYPSYSYDEQLIGSGVEPTPDWLLTTAPIRPDLPLTAQNVRIAYYADLHIPLSGTYTFHVASDDGLALSLDGDTLINVWADGVKTNHATRTLDAGPHLLRIDYFQAGGGKALRLEWSGAVARGVIPTAQLYPRHDLPEGSGANLKLGAWEGRTFEMPRLGFHTTNATGNAFTLGAAGSDVNNNTEGYQFLWQKVSGDFILDAKVEMDIDPLRPNAKAMLMCRNELPTRAPFLALTCVAANASGRLNVKQRLTQNANIDNVLPQWTGGITNPCHLRIKRVKGVFKMYYSDGGAWELLHTFNDLGGVFARNLYIGCALTAPLEISPRPLQEATFSEVSLRELNGTVLMIR